MKRAYQTPSVELEQLTTTTIVMVSPTNLNFDSTPVDEGGGGD